MKATPIIAFLALLSSLLIGTNVLGQENLSANTLSNYKAEAQAYRQDCETDLIKGNLYDCACLAGKFYAERLELGNAPDSSLINMNIVNSCHSESAAAEYSFERCMRRESAQNYCSCVSNKYAELWVTEYSERSFSPNIHMGMQGQAELYCE